MRVSCVKGRGAAGTGFYPMWPAQLNCVALLWACCCMLFVVVGLGGLEVAASCRDVCRTSATDQELSLCLMG
jgi:hypothetical protein